MPKPIFKLSPNAGLQTNLLIDVTEDKEECVNLLHGLHPSMTGAFLKLHKDMIAEDLYRMGYYAIIVNREPGICTIDYRLITNPYYATSFDHYYHPWIENDKKCLLVHGTHVQVEDFLSLRILHDRAIAIMPFLEPQSYKMKTKQYPKLDDLSKLNRAVPLEVNSSMSYYKVVPKIELSEKIVMSFTDKYGNEISITGIDREKMIEQIEKLK